MAFDHLAALADAPLGNPYRDEGAAVTALLARTALDVPARAGAKMRARQLVEEIRAGGASLFAVEALLREYPVSSRASARRISARPSLLETGYSRSKASTANSEAPPARISSTNCRARILAPARAGTSSVVRARRAATAAASSRYGLPSGASVSAARWSKAIRGCLLRGRGRYR